MSSRQARPSEKFIEQAINENIKRKIYFIRVTHGIIAGVISGFIPIQIAIPIGLLIAMLTYALSHLLVIKVYGSVIDPRLTINIGIFMYFIQWLIFWSMISTIIYNPLSNLGSS